MLVGEPKKSSSSSMRLWWVSMSLFMELAGEQGKVVTSCSTGIPHWEMRLDRSAESVVVSSSFTSSTSSSSWKRHGGLVGQVHLDLHPVVVDGGSVFNVKVVCQGLKETPLCQELRIHGWLGC